MLSLALGECEEMTSKEATTTYDDLQELITSKLHRLGVWLQDNAGLEPGYPRSMILPFVATNYKKILPLL